MKLYSRTKNKLSRGIMISILLITLSPSSMAMTSNEDINSVNTYLDTNHILRAPSKIPTKVTSTKELEETIEMATEQLVTKFTVKVHNMNYNQIEKLDLSNNDNIGERINAYKFTGKVNQATGELKEVIVELTYKKMYEVSKIYREPMKGYTISSTGQQVFIKTKSIIKNLGIKNMKSDYEKEKAIHDYIVANTCYTDKNRITDSPTDPIYGVEGVLLNQNAVCQGYAETMKMFMDILGIECKIVTGTGKSGESHAWNLIKLDNEWYHVDATWNDPIPDQSGHVSYSYFNLTDEMIKDDHIIDATKVYPKANGTRYFYYNNEIIVETEDELKHELSNMFANRLTSGKIYCSYKVDINQLEKTLDEVDINCNMQIHYTLEGKLFTFEATYQ